jgi:hypothetical protein
MPGVQKKVLCHCVKKSLGIGILGGVSGTVLATAIFFMFDPIGALHGENIYGYLSLGALYGGPAGIVLGWLGYLAFMFPAPVKACHVMFLFVSCLIGAVCGAWTGPFWGVLWVGVAFVGAGMVLRFRHWKEMLEGVPQHDHWEFGLRHALGVPEPAFGKGHVGEPGGTASPEAVRRAAPSHRRSPKKRASPAKRNAGLRLHRAAGPL